jgi:hypothetical protein
MISKTPEELGFSGEAPSPLDQGYKVPWPRDGLIYYIFVVILPDSPEEDPLIVSMPEEVSSVLCEVGCGTTHMRGQLFEDELEFSGVGLYKVAVEFYSNASSCEDKSNIEYGFIVASKGKL